MTNIDIDTIKGSVCKHFCKPIVITIISAILTNKIYGKTRFIFPLFNIIDEDNPCKNQYNTTPKKGKNILDKKSSRSVKIIYMRQV